MMRSETMKQNLNHRWLSLLLCVAILFTALPLGVFSVDVYAEDTCSHEYEVESYPASFGGTCMVRCTLCRETDSFATSTGMDVYWNLEGLYGTYYSLLSKTEYEIGEELYLWIQDYDDYLVPDEKIVSVSDSDGVTYTPVWDMMGYFTFRKPGIYTLTITDKYNPLVTASYIVTVTGSGSGSGGSTDNGCQHQYNTVVTAPGCLVQGYTTYTCVFCKDEYLSDFVDPKGHSFGGYINNGDGSKTSYCSGCDAFDTVRDANSDAVLTEQRAYEVMISLKDEYPEGMQWTNDNFYQWNGGYFYGGFGCVAFAFLLSDAVFGNLPAERITDGITIDMLRVGDVLRVNNDTHSVIVLEVHDAYIVIAEGNYNSSIHWERKMTAAEVAATTDYILTRYPEKSDEEEIIPGDVNDDGTVDARDITILRRYYVGWDVTLNEDAADVNDDGVIDARDITILRRYYVGWDVTLK